MKVMFTGSRDWIDSRVPRQILHRLRAVEVDTIVHGDARGLDRVVDSVAREPGLYLDEQIKRHPAKWENGKGAGYDRNLHMHQVESPDLLIALPLPGSRGTWHCTVVAECPTLIFIDGCRESIANWARETYGDAGVLWNKTVTDWVDEQTREAMVRARWLCSTVARSTIPHRPSFWWVLVHPKGKQPQGRVELLIEALVR